MAVTATVADVYVAVITCCFPEKGALVTASPAIMCAMRLNGTARDTMRAANRAPVVHASVAAEYFSQLPGAGVPAPMYW